MKCKRKDLLAVVERVMPGVGSEKALLEGVQTIVFTPSGLHTYNSRICVTSPFSTEDIFGSVSGDKLHKLLKKGKSEDLILSITEDALEIKAGKTIASLTFLKSEIVQKKIAAIHSLIPSQELPRDFRKSLMRCGIKGNITKWSGVYFKNSMVYGTNQVVSNFFNISKSMGEFWISQKNVETILKIKTELKAYDLTGKERSEWFHLIDEDGTIFSFILQDTITFVSALNFLLSQEGEEDKDKYFNTKIPEGFISAVDECSVLSSKSDDAKKQYVRVTFSEEDLVFVANSKNGKVTSTVDWTDKLVAFKQIEEGRYYVDYLKDASEKCKRIMIKPMTLAKNKKYPLIIMTTPGFKSMICPLFKKEV